MNKTFARLFLAGIILGSFSKSFALEYETIITPDAPGFFVVKIYQDEKDSTNNENCSGIIIAENFEPSKAKQYQALLDNTQDLASDCVHNTEIIKATALGQKQPPSNYDVIILGDPIKGYPNFSLKKSNARNFQSFIEENIHPRTISFSNISIQSDENISDIRANGEEINNKEPLTISGKFSKNIPSTITLIGKQAKPNKSFSFPKRIEIPIDFSNKELANDPLAKNLSNIWESLNKDKEIQSNNNQHDIFYPFLILGIILLLTTILVLYYRHKQRKTIEEKNRRTFLKNAPKTIHSNADFPLGSLPFEIEKKK